MTYSSSHSPESEVLVSIIIVNYNTRDMTLECLRCVYADLEGLPAEVIVVDNASVDGSADAIAQQFPSVRLIRSSVNIGFGEGNNLAFTQARGANFCLVNTDAFLGKGVIKHLLEMFAQHPDIGVVGPQLLNKDGSVQLSCFRFPSPLSCWMENLWLAALMPNHPVIGNYRHWDHATQRDVDFVVGACLLVRREAYEKVGGFDCRYFMYQEEADWEKRIHEAGWRVVFTPKVKVTHLGGESGKNEAKKISGHFFESLDRYTVKHHGTMGLALVRIAMVLGCSLRVVLWLFATLIPQYRKLAFTKLRLHAWLVRRQLLTALPKNIA